MPDSVKKAMLSIAKGFKPIIKIALIIALVIILLSASAYYIITEEGSYSDEGGGSGTGSGGGTGNSGISSILDDNTDDDSIDENLISDIDNVRYVLEEFINSIGIDTIASNGNGGYAYTTNLDRKIDKIFIYFPEFASKVISYIEEDDSEEREEKAKELIKKFIKAEIIGRYPDLRSKAEISQNKEVREDELQGGIKIVRRNSGTDTSNSNGTELTYNISGNDQILTYIPYEQFSNKLANKDASITNYFSLKASSGYADSVDIVVAGTTKETTTIEKTADGQVIDKKETKKDTYNEININYQNSLTKYSMPAGFLWSLLVTGEDTEFVEKLADLAIENTEIVIEAQDNQTTTVDTNIVTYEEVQHEIRYREETKIEEVEETQEDGTVKIVEKEVTVKVPYTVEIIINHIDTTTIKTIESNTRLNLAYAETWIATYKRLFQNDKSTESLNNNWKDEAEWKELTVDDIEVTKNENTVEIKNIKTTNNLQKINSNEYTFAGTEVQDRDYIDKEDNFITYFNNSGVAKDRVLETTSWLYEMLNSHEKTANMVDLVKYLLSRATGTDYGKTTYNFQEYNFAEFEKSQNSSGVRCPRYYQMDSKWSSKAYNYKTGGTIGKGGCGACALAMAVSGLTGTGVTPDVIVDHLNGLGINTVSNGAECAKKVAEKYGLTYEFINRTDKEKIDQALDNGKCLIFSVVANGIYTGEGHYIMCNGRNGNSYYVLESAHYYETDRPYEFDQVFTPGNQGIFVLGR